MNDSGAGPPNKSLVPTRDSVAVMILPCDVNWMLFARAAHLWRYALAICSGHILWKVMIMKNLIAVLALMLWMSGSVAAQKVSDKESLRGVTGMFVLVEDIDLDAQKDGLVRYQLQKESEQLVSAAGIRVLSLREMYNTKGEPYLYVNINAAKSSDGTYVYYVSVSFKQMAVLTRMENSQPQKVTSWETGAVGMVEKRYIVKEIRNAMNSRLDAFVKDYRSVNPK